MVDDAQPAAVVIATLAGEGQMGLAKEWAIHFKPDAPKLSRVRERGGGEALQKCISCFDRSWASGTLKCFVDSIHRRFCLQQLFLWLLPAVVVLKLLLGSTLAGQMEVCGFVSRFFEF